MAFAASLESLDHEVIVHLCSFLGHAELLRVAQLSHLWHSLTTTELLWQGLHQRTYGAPATSQPTPGLSWREEFTLSTQHPSTSLVEVVHHEDEVLFVAFSSDGQRLCSASRDCTAAIWRVVRDASGYDLQLQHSLRHDEVVGFVSWSPDDSLLLSCTNGLDDTSFVGSVLLWSVESVVCMQRFRSQPFDTFGAWWPDSTHLLVSSNLYYYAHSDHYEATLQKYSIDGELKNERTLAFGQGANFGHHLRISPNGERLCCMQGTNRCHPDQLRMVSLDGSDEELLCESGAILGFVISDDCSEVLINIRPYVHSCARSPDELIPDISSSMELHLWKISPSGAALNHAQPGAHVKTYNGHTGFTTKESPFMIFPSFAGPGGCWVMSGSEDGNLYVWHKLHAVCLSAISAHAATLNAVSCSPRNPFVSASGGDDHRIRLWGSRGTATRVRVTAKAVARGDVAGLAPISCDDVEMEDAALHDARHDEASPSDTSWGGSP